RQRMGRQQRVAAVGVSLPGSLPKALQELVMLVNQVAMEASPVVEIGRSARMSPRPRRCRHFRAPSALSRKLLFRVEADCAGDGRMAREIFTSGIARMGGEKSMTSAVDIWESSVLTRGNKLKQLTREEGLSPERSTAN